MFQLTRDEQLAIAFGLLIISVSVFIIFSNKSETERLGGKIDLQYLNNSSSASSNSNEDDGSQMIYVHVSGEILRPDVYKLKRGTRVFEVMKIAGLGPKADTRLLNLAEVVRDGEKIVVKRMGLNITKNTATKNGKRLININTASQEELEALSGIGPVYAGRIIEYRKKYPFMRIEDIVKVDGVGQKTFERFKDRICVE